jgi:UDP-N-acetylmuramoylalanine--D-glutamate ligase
MTVRITSPLPEGRRVLVVGLSRSGLAAARALHRLGLEVSGSDAQKELPEASLQELRALGVRLELGGHTDETFLGADWIVLSPGVPPMVGSLQRAREAGRPILGEMELAWRLAHASGKDVPFVAVTGTNGKSTTTMMVSKILEAAGREHLLGGNLGTPLADRLDPTPPLVVAEVSSFQLEEIQAFRPRVGAMLNLAPDHLDRYPDYESYVEAKARLCLNMGEGDTLVYNAADPATCKLVERWPRLGKKGFSRSVQVDGGAWLLDGDLGIVRDGGNFSPVLAADELPVRGAHNVENALAAIAITDVLGVGSGAMASALRSYKPLPHRCEPVGTIRGVHFYDDSKGTNVGATLVTLLGFTERTVLIAGGRAKGDDYTPLAEALARHGGCAVLIGESKDAIARALAGAVPYEMSASLPEATELALRRARPGDVVLLSPACSSFDMFRDYHHRGQVFQQAVAELAKAHGETP